MFKQDIPLRQPTNQEILLEVTDKPVTSFRPLYEVCEIHDELDPVFGRSSANFFFPIRMSVDDHEKAMCTVFGRSKLLIH